MKERSRSLSRVTGLRESEKWKSLFQNTHNWGKFLPTNGILEAIAVGSYETGLPKAAEKNCISA
jgi:hypothetical protein